MESILLLFGLGIMILVFVLLNTEKNRFNKKGTTNDEVRELEAIIDKYFNELQEENHKQNQAYLSDVNFLHKKVNTLEAKLKMLEKYKQIDIKVHSDGNNEIENNIQNRVENKVEKEIEKEVTSDEDCKNEMQNYLPTVNDSEMYKQVIHLHDQGYSVEEIAKKINIMCGEVQLIIGLHKRSHY